MTGGRTPFQKFVFGPALSLPLFLFLSLFHVKNARCFACGGRNVHCRCSASVTAMPYSYANSDRSEAVESLAARDTTRFFPESKQGNGYILSYSNEN